MTPLALTVRCAVARNPGTGTARAADKQTTRKAIIIKSQRQTDRRGLLTSIIGAGLLAGDLFGHLIPGCAVIPRNARIRCLASEFNPATAYIVVYKRVSLNDGLNLL
jgi:uncharacterized membrane protein